MVELNETILSFIVGGSILGLAYIQRGFIVMIMKTAIELMIRDAIDREKNLKAIIYESQTAARSQYGDNEAKQNLDTIPKIEEQLDEIKHDFVNILPMLNKSLDDFKIEMETFVAEEVLSQDILDVFIKYYEGIQDLIFEANNGSNDKTE